MKKIQPEVKISMDMFFNENEKDTGMYNAVLELTEEMLRHTNSFSFIIEKDADYSKTLFSSKLINITFHNVKKVTRIVTFESNIIKNKDEYTKMQTTIKNNYDEENFIIEYESYNGVVPYTINTLKTDINLDKINEKVLQKTL